MFWQHFCRCDKFKSVHTFLEAIEFIRSTKGGQISCQKHDLLQLLFIKKTFFEQTNRQIIVHHLAHLTCGDEVTLFSALGATTQRSETSGDIVHHLEICKQIC